MTAGAMYLVETAGDGSSDAGSVLHWQPVGSADPVQLIAAFITHPEEDFAVAAEIVGDAWAEWLAGDADRGYDFVTMRRGRHGGARIFTVVGSAAAVLSAPRTICVGYPQSHGSRSFLAIERHGCLS